MNYITKLAELRGLERVLESNLYKLLEQKTELIRKETTTKEQLYFVRGQIALLQDFQTQETTVVSTSPITPNPENPKTEPALDPFPTSPAPVQGFAFLEL